MGIVKRIFKYLVDIIYFGLIFKGNIQSLIDYIDSN